MDQDPSEDFVKAGKHNFNNLEYLDLRGNAIERIDHAILLAPKVKTLLLGGNKIRKIENLSDLPDLSVIEISDNAIEAIDDLNTKVGQLTRLDLANNKIKTLNGCTKLYSLQHLNGTSLFRNKKFMLDEKLKRNASKFAIYLEYENQRVFFRFSFRAALFFS